MTLDKMSPDAVLFEEIDSGSGYKLALMTLNVPEAMNAVDLDMVNLIDGQIEQWNQDNSIAAIIMCGAGEKAFCAGGNILKLYDSMINSDEDQRLQYADAFFKGEYAKNYRLHQVTKPLIAWGHGFVMGGGLGLFIAANHRVGSECLKLAWPEVRIGLYPDVAASYYLSRLPYPVGHWMGLSGSHMNTTDSKKLKLIQYAISHTCWQTMIDTLLQQNWSNNRAVNHQHVRAVLNKMDADSVENMPASQLDDIAPDLEYVFSDTDLKSIAARMRQYKTENQWLKQGLDNFEKACPATAHLIMRQIAQGPHMSLREVVSWELTLAYQAVRHPDFCEGIRAMVVDKDYKPVWQHKTVNDVPAEWVKQLTTNPWAKGNHPYSEL